MEEFVNYVESWEFWFRIVWYSSAIGFGLVLGGFLYLGVMAILDKLVERLMNLEFKKNKGKEN